MKKALISVNGFRAFESFGVEKWEGSCWYIYKVEVRNVRRSKTRKKVEPPLKREKERAMTIPKMKPLRFTLSSLEHGQETKTWAENTSEPFNAHGELATCQLHQSLSSTCFFSSLSSHHRLHQSYRFFFTITFLLIILFNYKFCLKLILRIPIDFQK